MQRAVVVVVDADRTTTRAGQARPDLADHCDVRLRGHRVKGGDLDILLATADANELYFVATDILLL